MHLGSTNRHHFVVQGGHLTADTAKDTIAEEICRAEGFQCKPPRLEDAIVQAFAAIDVAGRTKGQDGACCACALLVPTTAGVELLVGWVGDCRCVLVENNRIVLETRDHHPDQPEERARIEASPGGFVEEGGDGKIRSYGILAVSRALGDAVQKGAGSAVCCVPEFARRKLSDQSELLLLGSDGVFETLGSQAVVDIALKHKKLSAKGMARKIARTAAVKRDNYDDTTALVVRLCGRDGEAAGLLQQTLHDLAAANVGEVAATALPSEASGNEVASLPPTRRVTPIKPGVDHHALEPGESQASWTCTPHKPPPFQ